MSDIFADPPARDWLVSVDNQGWKEKQGTQENKDKM